MRLLASKRMSSLYERRAWTHRAELAQAVSRLQELEAELGALHDALSHIESELAALWQSYEGDRLSRCALFEVKQKEGVLLSRRLDLSTNLTQTKLRVDAASDQAAASQSAFSQASKRSSLYARIFKRERVKKTQMDDLALESDVQEMAR